MDKTVSPTPASKEPAQERSPDLSYSLFPAPMDWSQYIDDTPPKPKSSLKSALKTTPKAPTAAPESPADTPTPEDSAALRTEASVPRGRSTAQEAASTSTPMRKKRKRAPSPDVIPNPPGCSYGLHPDYFGYNSDIDDEGDDEDEELAPATEPQREDEKGKSAVRSILRSERPLSKRVRFDASPQDTPSKLRMKPRATDPYTGEHFIGMDISPESSNSIPTVAPTPNPQAKQPTVYPDPRSRPGFVPNRDDDEATTPGFVPNRTGTFETPYSDDPSEPSASAPDAVPDAQTAEQTETPSQPDATEITPLEEKQAIVPPSTPAKVEDEALARVRLQAEKYKPKTPSGLRTASRYSTPSTIAATPDAISALVPAPASVPAFAPVPALDFEGASDAEDFGDDQFARDAQWLYENCPTGDLSELVWPDAENYEAMGFSTEAVRIANELWDPSVVDHAYDNIWTPGLEAFRREMETVSSHATLT
ncbi:uncharacterized protein BP01DRAFT_361438 [Aspergillus saccharolyticus JOP 1030-1]|uniref:Uncharacterized protein n=1 Tax=Aspergillus saccharolyticus JOP 1030-1 TaxID=1450539 RepID=A0A318Z1I6_9EURO|nr:hypothetical protein BP01DRAFT_361438 [Aspergillus saccharolyticus JOP 1030-1]PYH40254.1 hypothetical protein BP01DRAFT_361438 [Aspergillus saccharolyticus JOP 1030-1]